MLNIFTPLDVPVWLKAAFRRTPFVLEATSLVGSLSGTAYIAARDSGWRGKEGADLG